MPVWGQIVVAVAAGFTVVAGFWRGIVKPASRALVVMEQQGPVLLEIAAEFKPNHGNSLRDRINAIDGQLRRQGQQLKEQGQQLKDHRDKLDRIDNRLDKLEA